MTPPPFTPLTARLLPLVPALLVVLGLGCLVVAAFTYAIPAGWAATGLALLALEYAITAPRDSGR